MNNNSIQTATCRFSFRLPSFAFRRAMTLIELMVVIVILVTLVAGVLPLVSPNNDARKISEAARGMQTFLMQAQAEAARIGRPVGVGFRETAADSGVAIEAYQMVVPPPYTGFGPEARVRILYPFGTYGTEGYEPKGGTLFRDLYNGRELYMLEFVRSPLKLKKNLPTPPETPYVYDAEYFPDNMLKWGDVINLEGNEFLIVDDNDNANDTNDIDQDTDYLLSTTRLSCLWLNNFGQQPPEFTSPTQPGSARVYRIFRQPANTTKFGPSSEAAYQFPAGVAIDLQASGLEANEFELFSTQNKILTNVAGTTTQGQQNVPRSIAVMFSPNGGIESVWRNGVKLIGTTRAFFILGRQENGNPDFALYDFGKGQDLGGVVSDEELRDRRTKVNWLNMDSRWLVINGADGRLTVHQNASFDPRKLVSAIEFEMRTIPQRFTTQEIAARGGLPIIRREITRKHQIEAAHEFVHGDAGAEP